MNILLDFAKFYIHGNEYKTLENRIKMYSLISSKKRSRGIHVGGYNLNVLEGILDSAEHDVTQYAHDITVNAMRQIKKIPKPRRFVERFSYWLGYKL